MNIIVNSIPEVRRTYTRQEVIDNPGLYYRDTAPNDVILSGTNNKGVLYILWTSYPHAFHTITDKSWIDDKYYKFTQSFTVTP